MQKIYPSHEKQPPLEELAQVRIERGLTQKDLADRLGVSRLYVVAVETGRRQPSTELTLRWLNALKPRAKLAMFGNLPLVAHRIRLLKQLSRQAHDAQPAA